MEGNKLDIREKIDFLNYHTKLYDSGKPEISDSECDKIYFEVAQYERDTGDIYPDSPTQKISYNVVSNLKKVRHNHPMLSLDKTKDWSEFLDYFGTEDLVGMVKLDGLTCCLTYQDGKLVSAETRGNGEVGEDIFHNALVISSIPKRIDYKDELVVDGEVVCKAADFESYAEEYATQRNFASGSIRLLDSKECEKRNLTFVAWNVVKGKGETVISRFYLLSQLGFTVVPWTSGFDLDAKEFLVEQAEKAGYPIDGLVGRFNDVAYGESLGRTTHHSKAAYAFKFYDETYSTKLKNIEWSLGRTGILTPVAVFDPVVIDSAVIEKASLHNVSVMREVLGDCAYLGQPLEIIRANQVIPQVQSAVKKTHGEMIPVDRIDKCPVCGKPLNLAISESGVVNMVCDNPSCEGKLVNIFDHFCGKSGLDIKGLSKTNLEKLINLGWLENLSDIFNLSCHKEEWKKQIGFGPKSVENILAAIEESRRTELWRAISAASIPYIGVTASKQLADYFGSYEAFRDATKSNFDFSAIENFGSVMGAALKDYDYQELDKIISDYLTFGPKEEKPKISNMDGLTFAITGKVHLYRNRSALQKEIESRGGKVTVGVSSHTNYLINNDNTSSTAKNQAAKKLNIPIITEKEFVEKFLDI
jgi:DNA ligase (NAD+)